MTDLPTRDPLLDESALPFAAPNFEEVRTSDILPAITLGIAEATRDIERIADEPAPPSFSNTIEALERAGSRLSRARRIF